MIEHYQLIRIYGDIEPTLIGGPIPANEDALEGTVVKHLEKESYNDSDGLFYAHLEDGRLLDLCTFSGWYMEALRRRAGESVPA